VCDLCLLNPAFLVVRGLSEVLGALRQILLSYLVHMHNRLRSLRQGQVHVGPITWEVLPQKSRPTSNSTKERGPNASRCQRKSEREVSSPKDHGKFGDLAI
jgi:hypothetical protein